MGMSTGDRNRNDFFRNSALVFICGNPPAFFFYHLIPWLAASVTLRALRVFLGFPSRSIVSFR